MGMGMMKKKLRINQGSTQQTLKENQGILLGFLLATKNKKVTFKKKTPKIHHSSQAINGGHHLGETNLRFCREDRRRVFFSGAWSFQSRRSQRRGEWLVGPVGEW